MLILEEDAHSQRPRRRLQPNPHSNSAPIFQSLSNCPCNTPSPTNTEISFHPAWLCRGKENSFSKFTWIEVQNIWPRFWWLLNLPEISVKTELGTNWTWASLYVVTSHRYFCFRWQDNLVSIWSTGGLHEWRQPMMILLMIQNFTLLKNSLKKSINLEGGEILMCLSLVWSGPRNEGNDKMIQLMFQKHTLQQQQQKTNGQY